MSERILRFGPFELRPERGQLLNRGAPVGLGSRALAILTLLAERAGEIVSVGEINSHVWPNLFVQDNNLRVHLTAIRRAFRAAGANDVEIINVPGRGYRLRSEVTIEGDSGADAGAGSGLRPIPIPLQVNRLIGRADCVASVVESVGRNRLVTVIGPGGIGKTSVALAGLHAFPAGTATCFVDLANCASVEHVATAVAAALQSPMGSDATPAVLIEHLRDADLILLLDNCEHLVDIIARVAETVIQSCPRVKLLATSREPLRVPGEVLLHLQPLPVPSLAETAGAISESPAVRLFVERAQASADMFSITADNAEHVAAVCRSLDGLPLALELAAAAVPMVGIDELSTGLTQRLSRVAFGRRTLARHETLDAMLDWSFELLSPAQRVVLCSLGSFRSSFDLAGAVQVAALDDCGEEETIQAVLQLAAKSLLVVETTSSGVAYRLLETTKVYARRKLSASGQSEIVARRHAEWVRGLLERAQDDWLVLDRPAWWGRYGQAIDDVRAALAWSLGEAGDKRLGISLTLASAPLWIGLAQFAEYNRWLLKALATLEELGETGGPEEIQLQIGLCVLLFNEDRPGEQFVRAATRVLRIGEKIGDPWARATGLWLLSGHRQILSDHPGALALARQMLPPDSGDHDPDLLAFARRVIALMTFRAGRIAESAAIGTKLVADLTDRTAYGAVLRYDHYTVARSNHALTLAVQGQLDSALSLIMDAVADGARLRNPASFCYLLSSAACPVALWVGDHELARIYADLLAREASDNRFTYMGELATWYSRILELRTGQLTRPLVIDQLPRPLPHDKDVFITTCAACCDEEAVARAEALDPHWATAEILRAHGEIQLASGDEVAARALFTRALSIAEEQESWLWALRAATSLARLEPPDKAAPPLEAALARVEGGARSLDLRSARMLLSGRVGEP
ncbi:helix-turn-helix transcriptional regulator [Sphingomonas sediminicola]|uniref:Helix-turn-helix transcriptional regulator n=1 Tax=Sphingomonas sediminicola TaxID=386874 RepID=A0ABX6T8R6_9SPHN|nr:winged helix-turn-helix domain-containing protein [Sphingomonas sediminicola]QNP46236.1 helix-turn-helix transcriptional regulator [Sphingomonas sediminicola]